MTLSCRGTSSEHRSFPFLHKTPKTMQSKNFINYTVIFKLNDNCLQVLKLLSI